MSLLFDDEACFIRFKRIIEEGDENDDEYRVRVFQWPRETSACDTGIRVSEIDSLGPCKLRIIFTELDQPKQSRLAGFKALVKKYNIPSVFLEERTNSVTNSFGVRTEKDGAHSTWAHFLQTNFHYTNERLDERGSVQCGLIWTLLAYVGLDRTRSTESRDGEADYRIVDRYTSRDGTEGLTGESAPSDTGRQTPSWVQSAFFVRTEYLRHPASSTPSTPENPASTAVPGDLTAHGSVGAANSNVSRLSTNPPIHGARESFTSASTVCTQRLGEQPANQADPSRPQENTVASPANSVASGANNPKISQGVNSEVTSGSQASGSSGTQVDSQAIELCPISAASSALNPGGPTGRICPKSNLAEGSGEIRAPQDENERLSRQSEHHGGEMSVQASSNFGPQKCVTLICFGASTALRRDLEFAVSQLGAGWEDITHDPVILYDVIFADLYTQIVFKMSVLIHVYRGIRKRAIYSQFQRPDTLFEVGFAELHELSDYFMKLGEAIEATMLSLQALHRYHAQWQNESSCPIRARTQQALQYREELFCSLRTRAATFDKKVNNLINMFFHRLAQHDSAVMLRDSDVMKFSTVLVVIFVPVTIVSSIYGSQFFSLQRKDNGKVDFVVHPAIVNIIYISLPFTVLLLGTLYYKYQSSEDRFQRRQALRKRTTKNINLRSNWRKDPHLGVV